MIEHVANNFNFIQNKINGISKFTRIVVVSKKRSYDQIQPLLQINHLDYGENQIQEALNKWPSIIASNKEIRLHLIGRLQSNKAKAAFNLFEFIHSLDSEKLAKIFSTLEKEARIKKKYFIQVNIGNENQKAGISADKINQFSSYCIKQLNLNVLGLMCIPPMNQDPKKHFIQLNELNVNNGFKELSMGMSNDYVDAIQCGSTCVRIGSAIFD
ncbi:COG0325 Predicted enzyme with a TIM-barrel fold [Candidatus Pelagibacterales bacterium]